MNAGAPWYERIPPPVWLLGCLGAGWGLDKVVPFPIPFPTFGWQLGPALVLFALAAGTGGWAFRLFRRHRTTVLPFGSATSLLTSGPFRISRNPLYVALVATLAGLGLLLGTFWVLASAGVLAVALDRLVIRGEESVLTRLFGSEYSDYAGRVRRWL